MLPGKHANGQGNVHTFRVNILATRRKATGGTTCEHCQVDWGSLLRENGETRGSLYVTELQIWRSLFTPEPRSSKQGGGALVKSIRGKRNRFVLGMQTAECLQAFPGCIELEIGRASCRE